VHLVGCVIRTGTHITKTSKQLSKHPKLLISLGTENMHTTRSHSSFLTQFNSLYTPHSPTVLTSLNSTLCTHHTVPQFLTLSIQLSVHTTQSHSSYLFHFNSLYTPHSPTVPNSLNSTLCTHHTVPQYLPVSIQLPVHNMNGITFHHTTPPAQKKKKN
jgi:hypothetical protein